jgi:tRNA nucleotidyltransferase/poly(A) polymerase
VTFATAEEDAARRDFTINGMFFDPTEEKVIDFVGGRADLDARVIRRLAIRRSVSRRIVCGCCAQCVSRRR